MRFIVDAKGVNSPECRELMSKYSDKLIHETRVPCLLTLSVENAFLSRDFSDNNRPYLMLLGRPIQMKGSFPCNISTLRYQTPLERTLTMYRYDFTRKAMTEITEKGLYDGLEVPNIIKHNDFELPAEVECIVIPPEDENDVAVAFASLAPESLRTNDYKSGYGIAEYFEEVPEVYEQQNDPRYTLKTQQQHVTYERVKEEVAEKIAEDLAPAIEIPEKYSPPEPKPEAKSETPKRQRHGIDIDIPEPAAPDDGYDYI